MIRKHEAAITPRGSPRARSPARSGSPLPHRARTTSPPGASARESMSSFSTRLSERLSAVSPRPSRETTTGHSLLLERLSATSPPRADLATGSSRPSEKPRAPSPLTSRTELPSGTSRITGRSSAISPLPSRDFTSGSLRILSRSSAALSPVASLKDPLSSSSRPSEWPSALSPLLSSQELRAGSIMRQAARPLASASLASADLLTSNALRMKELDASLRSAETVLGGSSASRDLTSTSLTSTVAPLQDDASSSKRPVSSIQSFGNNTSRSSPLRGSAREKESLADRRVRESHQACSSALASQSGSMFRSSSAAGLERMRHSQSPIFHTGRRSESSLLAGAEASSSKEGKRVSWESPTPLSGPVSTPHSRRKLFY
mmetsp:Transcript_55228/g.103711  ORF Transcript_55228/g.103711 Transcript_55228/m.103711 type:complete len:375 (-) Transcript_55228:53-1177(-)